MFKNIIFDWSGVIKDALGPSLWVVGRMMETLGGKKISLKEFQENWEQPYMKFWNKYFPELNLGDEQKLYYSIISQKDCPKANVYPGVVDLIKKIKKDKKFIAVLSSDSPKTLLPEIKEYSLENIFDEVVTDVHDKTEGMKSILKKNNLNKKETIFIGDSNHEIEVGQDVGIKTIAVTWGFCTEEKLKATNPDYLVHSVGELGEILLK